MSIRCQDALPLVPPYVDGELSEAQAAPLREHLLGCQACRGSAQNLKGLKRWFAPSNRHAGNPDDRVPAGFAARVARRAFAGDTGERPEAPLPTPTIQPARAAHEHTGFIRELTGLAAALLVALTIGLRMQDVPSGERLRADEMMPLTEVRDRLDQLNETSPGPGGSEAVPLDETTD